MCMLCAALVPDDHWSDGVAGAAEPAVRARYRRARILSAVLAPYGLTVSDPGTGPHCTIADRKGAAEVAAGLPEVWAAVDRLSPRPVDVLDPALLAALTVDGDTVDGDA